MQGRETGCSYNNYVPATEVGAGGTRMGWRFDRGDIRSCKWGSNDSGCSFLVCLLVSFLTILLFFAPRIEAASAEQYDYDDLDRLIRTIDEQGQVTEYIYDDAGNLLQVVTGGTATSPVVTGVAPDSMRRGESKRIRATGTGLTGARLSVSDPSLQLTDVLVSATQVDFTLNALDSVVLGPQPIVFSNAAGSTSAALIVNPVLPSVNVSPAPLAVPPDNLTRPFTIRLSSADNIDHSITLSSANTVIASVAPATLTILAGQTEASASITGHQAGLTNITLASSTLGTTLFPVFVTAEFRGLNTSFAPLVGVVVEQQPQPGPTQTITPFGAPHLGVVVGSYLQAISPKAAIVGTGPTDLTITGKGLSVVTDVAITPADGVTLGNFTVNVEGTGIAVPITVAADAPLTLRQLVLTAGTQTIPPAVPDADRLLIAPPAPVVESVEPIFVLPGTASQSFVIRGRNFRNLERIEVTPALGIAVGSNPFVNAAGTEIAVRMAISPVATIGPHVITVGTASGTSNITSTPENTFTVVNEIQDTFTPIAAAAVGVVKEVEPAPASQTIRLQGVQLGVSVGSVVTGVTPGAGAIGDTFDLTVQGFELQNATEIKFVPDTGITVGSLTLAPDGRSLTIPVTLAEDAPLTVRTVQVLAGTVVLPPAPASATQFRVTTPLPRVDSVSPLFLQVGQAPATFTIRGVNYRDLQGVRVVPGDGITLGTPSVNSTFTELSLAISAAANAVLGPRVVVVETAAGATSSEATVANTITLTAAAGTIFTPILAPNLGVVKEPPPQPPLATPVGPFVSVPLGVVVEQEPPAPAQISVFLAGAQLGIAVGPIATGISPAGIARGASGILSIQGQDLSAVTSVTLHPSDGIILDPPLINAEGTQLTVVLSVAPDAAPGLREVGLNTASGTVPFSNASANRFYIAIGTPQIDSITPILAAQGSTFTMTIRGSNFQNASAVTAEPPDGIVFGSTISVNSLGTEITIPMHVPANSPLGSRVIRVTTPAGVTTSGAAPANTFTVVAP